jgi:RNA polymerase sigma-70 factor, ECF subfamily
MDFAEGRNTDSLALDDALRKLAELDERKSRVIELKFFGGITAEEIGLVVGISVATVGRELRLGQAWLHRELSSPSAGAFVFLRPVRFLGSQPCTRVHLS